MPHEGRRRFTGIILGANETHVRLRLDDGSDVSLPLNDVRRAKLLLTDALIAATAPTEPETELDVSRPDVAGPKLAN